MEVKVARILKPIKHFSAIFPLLFTLNCFSIHKPHPEPIEKPKSNTVQNSNDSMVEAQRAKKDTTLGAVPTRTEEVKKFDPKTEKKIEGYITELITTGRITLPKSDAWMAKEINKRVNPRNGWYYFISIHSPDRDGNVEIYVVGRMQF